MISIIIPCKSLMEAIKCIDKCKDLDYHNFEIIVLPDNARVTPFNGNVRFIPTGPKLPSYKRDIGIKEAKGEIVAFIDSDAWPRKDWLYQAMEALDSLKEIGGVCGPGLLSKDSPENEKVSDWIFRHLPRAYRVQQYKYPFFLDDYPTFNLIFKKDIVKKVGGFSCDYLTGEDTIICKKIVNAGYKILYDPDVVVYHRRRPIWKPLFKQVATWGKHTGHFIRRGIW